jgi:hypothetical protein
MRLKFKGGTVVRYGRIEGAEPVPLGDRLVVPDRFYALIEPDDPSLPICNVGCVVERGRTVCVDLRCERREGAAPITGGTLRELPIGLYVREATRAVTRRLVQDGDEIRAVPVRYGELLPEEVRDGGDTLIYGPGSRAAPEEERFDAQYAQSTGAARRRGPLRDEDLRRVAEVYRAAHATDEAPTRAVAARFGVSRSTAGRWVAEARRRGVLGKARARKAGEQED